MVTVLPAKESIMKKPILSFNNINNLKPHENEPTANKPVKPKSIVKREHKHFVKQKNIKFLADLQIKILFKEKPTPVAFFNGIKEQNEKFHSEHFDQELKDDIDQLCDQGIKDFGHLKMSELQKIINLLKLGYNLFNSNNQHIYPILQYGKATLDADVKRGLANTSDFDWDKSWNYLIELKKKGVEPHKYNKSLREKFYLSEKIFKPIVKEFKKNGPTV
jgi:hypothetical protein